MRYFIVDDDRASRVMLKRLLMTAARYCHWRSK